MKVGFKNIRVFKELTIFDLRPMTILTGPNNSGKSGVGKILYLLSNAFKKDLDGNLDLTKIIFTEEIIKELGPLKDNITYNSKEKMIEFSFNYITNSTRVSGITTRPMHIDFHLKYRPGNSEFENIAYLDRLELKVEGLLVMDLILTKYKFNDHFIFYYASQEHLKMACNLRILLLKYKEIEKEIKSQRTFDNNSENIFETEDFFDFCSDYYGQFKNSRDNLLFQSLFCDLISTTPAFFEKNNISENTYGSYLKYILNSNGLYSYNEFIEAYIDFEIKFLKLVLDSYFIKPQKTDNGFPIGLYSKSFANILEDIKHLSTAVIPKRELIESIDNPLSKLFLLENDLSNIFGGDKINLPAEANFLIDTISHQSQNKLFSSFGEINFYKAILHEKIFYSSLGLPTINYYNQNQKINDYYLANDKDSQKMTFFKFGDRFTKGKIQSKSKEFVDNWIKKLNIGDKLIIETINVKNENIGYSFFIKEGKMEHPLKNIGFGINKLLQILMEIAMFDAIVEKERWVRDMHKVKDENGKFIANETLLLEEPESNLHPSFQSKLAEIFAEAITLFGINILVETHSEYLIRKVQYLTAKKEISIDDVSIYYFNAIEFVTEKDQKVKEITINTLGGLTDSFGPGFFDESTHLQFELLKLNKGQSN